MCGTGRNTAHKIHTQPLRSTQGMFSAHFTICAGARRGDSFPLILQVRVGEKTKSGGGTGPVRRHSEAPARSANFYLVRN